MKEDVPGPQINVSKIKGDGGIAGAIFAISSLLIFLVGIPMLRYFLPAALVLGVGIALTIKLVRYFVPPETPGMPWILSAMDETTPAPEKPQSNPDDMKWVILPA